MLRALVFLLTLAPLVAHAQPKYTGADGRVRVALSKQPFSPNGVSKGPDTMATGGIQETLAKLGATTRVHEARLTAEEDKEYGGWKRLGMALDHFADIEQHLLDESRIEQVSVDDLRRASPAVFEQLDRLNRLTDKIYVHIDMDVLDPREVMGHGNKVPNGPSSEQLAALFEQIFRRYPKASGIGFATIPARDEGGLSIAAVNRMVAGAVKGVQAREGK